MSAIRWLFSCFAAVAALVSCTDSWQGQGGVPGGKLPDQFFTVAVESSDELFSAGDGIAPLARTRRPISSVNPAQTFDRMRILIVEYASPAPVIWQTTIDDWSNPDNQASVPWSSATGRGRYATIRLPEHVRLEEDKTYMAYAIGYQTVTYGNYAPFAGVETGGFYRRTEVASVAPGEHPEEVFAGAEIFFVKGGVIRSQRSAEAESENGLLVARRQMAGTFGYFTRIPAVVGGVEVATLRLVASRCNRSVIFGGFRGVDDAFDFLKDNVINGTEPRTDCDARLDGSQRDDAFTVYAIGLNRWFPGNEADDRLPLDANGDGWLDEADANWQTDAEQYPAGTISLPPGTVFGDRFLIATAMTRAEVEADLPTFQLQLLDAVGRIVKHWDVTLRDPDPEADSDRTLVSLPDGPEGRTRITRLENVDTERCFSIVRNRLYTVGEKSQSQSYGEDHPVDLSAARELVMDARHEWQIANFIIFD